MSTFLDFLRFGGAVLVVFAHIDTQTFGGWLWQLRPYGAQGVVIFFVMSGYVIAHTAATKNKTLREYAVARAARLYSVVVPALVLTIAVDLSERLLSPRDALGPNVSGTSISAIFESALYNLTFTSQLWFLNKNIWNNLPFWSLGYEVWYYVIFAAATYFQGVKRTVLVMIVAAVMGPRILLLFPLWLLGVVAYRLGTQVKLRSWVAWTLFLASGLAALFLVVENVDASISHAAVDYFGSGMPSGLMPLNTDLFYLLGLAVALNILSFKLIDFGFGRLLQIVAGPIKYVAGATFSTYLFHSPVIAVMDMICRNSRSSIGRTAFLYVALFAVLFGLAELTERRKAVWTRLFARLIHPVAGNSLDGARTG